MQTDSLLLILGFSAADGAGERGGHGGPDQDGACRGLHEPQALCGGLWVRRLTHQSYITAICLQESEQSPAPPAAGRT